MARRRIITSSHHLLSWRRMHGFRYMKGEQHPSSCTTAFETAVSLGQGRHLTSYNSAEGDGHS